MKVSVRTHPAGFPIYTVVEGEHEFELSAFGAQLLDWTKSGVSILFANREHAVIDGKTAYRGGAPICFPYFGRGTLMPQGTTLSPQHGAARTTVWESEVGESSIVFRTEQPSAEGYGPTTLGCELTYAFGDGVRLEARVTNIGENETPFQLAVHSYWSCADPGAATVSGLGEDFLDNFASFVEATDPASSAPHAPPFDRVYPNAADTVELATADYRVSISTQGCAGAVLWNPGADHTIADLGAPDFVCVESGIIVPSHHLAPGEEHLLVIDYRTA